MQLRVAVVLLAGLASGSAALASKDTLTADAFFPSGSAAATAESAYRLTTLVCQAQVRRVEYVVAVGHADSTEPGAQRLSEARALNVLRQLRAAGLPGTPWAEGKGARQPVADNATAEGRKRNRRVEVELISYPRPSPDGGNPRDCTPAWERDLPASGPSDGLALARKLVREGLSAETMLYVAMDGTPELFAALWNPRGGLRMDRGQRRAVFLAVLRNGDPALIDRAMAAGWPALTAQDDPLTTFVCGRSGRAETVRMLLARGARPGTQALGCAIRPGGLEVVDLLLSAGADARRVPGWVARAAVAGWPMIDRLMAAGADPTQPLPKSYGGGTLFHAMRLTGPDDIRRLQALGLDINARKDDGETPLAAQLFGASPDLLDAMLQAGATLDEPEWGLLAQIRDNVPAGLWLLRHGASLTRTPALVVRWVERGERMLPLVQAYRDRGGDLEVRNQQQQTALAVAVRQLHVPMVAFLLDAGANRTGVEPGKTALELAEAIDTRVQPPPRVFGEGRSASNAAAEPPPSDPRRVAAKQAILRLMQPVPAP